MVSEALTAIMRVLPIEKYEPVVNEAKKLRAHIQLMLDRLDKDLGE